MRYRIGEQPEIIAGPLVDNGAFAGIAILSCLIGIGFVFAGLRSRHYWLTTWGSGLLLTSIGYLAFIALT